MKGHEHGLLLGQNLLAAINYITQEGHELFLTSTRKPVKHSHRVAIK